MDKLTQSQYKAVLSFIKNDKDLVDALNRVDKNHPVEFTISRETKGAIHLDKEENNGTKGIQTFIAPVKVRMAYHNDNWLILNEVEE